MSDLAAAFYLAAVLNIAGYLSECKMNGQHWADPIIETIGEIKSEYRKRTGTHS